MNLMNDELLDLLTARALGELAPADEARLHELLVAAGLDDSDDMELAVAAAMNAFAGEEPPAGDARLPEDLKQKLRTGSSTATTPRNPFRTSKRCATGVQREVPRPKPLRHAPADAGAPGRWDGPLRPCSRWWCWSRCGRTSNLGLLIQPPLARR
ncbi:MAG: hypothetical protein ACPGJE_00905 [Wenzhouxiangellaceae bacterium]